MRIESVTAHAFGPLHDRTLPLAPGLTVVSGLNESAKSSWHAAIRAALCGEPSARHRPWDGESWRVAATVSLASGEVVTVDRDLDEDSCPDVARHVGLDRTSFAATACVDQAQLLSVLDAADGLQDHLRRAAATAGTDGTVEQALLRLNAPVDALREARNRLREAETDLAVARREHARYQDLSVKARSAAAARARMAVQEHSAVVDALAARVTRLTELQKRFGDGPPSGLAAQEELTHLVNRALAAWRAAPTPRVLTGPSSSTLQGELEALPEFPCGETALDDDLRVVASAYETASAVAAAHDERRPSPATTAEPSVLRGLATRLDPASGARLTTASIEVDTARLYQDEAAANAARVQVEADVAAARVQEIAMPNPFLRIALLALSCLTTLVGLLLFLVNQEMAAMGVLVAAFVAGVGGALARGNAPQRDDAVAFAAERAAAATEARSLLFAADRKLAEAEGQRAVALEAVRVHDEATASCAALGIPPDRETLWRLANRAAWEAEHADLVCEVARTEKVVRVELAARGKVDNTMSVPDLLIDYETDCKVRARQALMAAQRPLLARALEDRLLAEATVAEATAAHDRALSLLREAVTAIGGSGERPEDLLRAIAEWQRGWDRRLREAEEERNAWAELQSLLADGTLNDLETTLSAAQNHHAALLADAARYAACAPVDPSLAAAAESLAATVAELARALPGVPEAEEDVQAAAAVLAEVQAEVEAIDLASRYLVAAREKVHSTIAPALEDTLRSWLPLVTDGRYVDAAVDPLSLTVRVCAASETWHQASRLSLGTTEQVYLLLRVALAQHLATEACPLLLDDVTVQADDARTRAVLDLLLRLSEDRQIVLFAQETAVVEWARERLGERDVLHQLMPVAV
ncbi:AAA domain-containing protein [Lentzea atacamensis]|uniref:AAA domain-containing protein n=1 Tax=Lentzea atacamensis TaxID=531938 RepID=A0A316HHE3_9PSEU|nr:AAA family ATPase [Lentzea atacamensis]PWK79410.1 AAA domain-containing protein [Lentzea atacamensis]